MKKTWIYSSLSTLLLMGLLYGLSFINFIGMSNKLIAESSFMIILIVVFIVVNMMIKKIYHIQKSAISKEYHESNSYMKYKMIGFGIFIIGAILCTGLRPKYAHDLYSDAILYAIPIILLYYCQIALTETPIYMYKEYKGILLIAYVCLMITAIVIYL